MAPSGKKSPWLSLSAAVFLIVLGIGRTPESRAADYPSRPVTVIVPFAAGTVTDIIGRLLARHFQDALDQPFIVENRPGASGMVGASHVARSSPDGYTLLVTTNTTHSTIKSLFKNVPYDPLTDFTPIARFIDLPSLMLVVNLDVPVKTIEEFVEYAKAHPNELQYGYGNGGSYLAGEAFKKKTDIRMTPVPYGGTPQAITDLIAGNTKVLVVDVGAGLPQVQAGKMRPLALLSAKRSPFLPDLPTLSETVARDFDMTGWGGVFGPAGMKEDTVRTLADEVKKFITKDDVKKRLLDLGIETSWTGPEQFADFLKSEVARWTTTAREAGVEPQ